MLRLVFAMVSFCLASTALALAQPTPDAAVMEQGKAIFEGRCAMCHKTDGAGTTDVFPALRGNEALKDTAHIVTNLHAGGTVMPPFPTLSDDEIAAVASYVRNYWGNTFGAVAADEVATIKSGLEPAGPTRTIWDGVYTQAQADRGKTVFPGPCGRCHGTRLNGAPNDPDQSPAPALARDKFLRAWQGRTLGALYSFTRWTMPNNNPGFLSEEDYVAIIAHMLSVTGAPAGDTALPVDVGALGHILIEPKP